MPPSAPPATYADRIALPPARGGWRQQYANGTLAPEQFDSGVDAATAQAICGEVAAVAFARAYGRNPTVAEALDIARRNGRWDANVGMHGPPSEKALLDDMGIPNRLEPNPSQDAVLRDLDNGNPVILSSPGHYHYFVVTGYRRQADGSVLFDTGNTGMVFKDNPHRYWGWDEIAPQAALFMQEPSAPGPSTATASDMSPQQGRQATSTTGGSIESYVRERAQAYGIDPDTAVAVANAEGGVQDWARQSDYVYKGKREESYGPFQLFMSGGLGNAFQQETGLDPRDPANGPAATDWALRYAAQHGWGDWHGARRIGLSDFAGIGGTPSTAGATTTTPGGTPLGRTGDSPFAPAEQPADATTYGANAPSDGASDPWAPVDATLDRVRRGVADLNQGATDTLNAASDTGVGLLNTVGDRLIDPNTYRQSLDDVGMLAGQGASGADAALREAYRTSPGQTVTGIARWVRTGDASGLDDPLQRALQFLPGQAGAGAFGVESAAIDPLRRVGVGGALALGVPQVAARAALAPLAASGLVDVPTPTLPTTRGAQERYAQLPSWLQTATSMVLDPANLVGVPPAGRALARGVEAGAQEVGRLGEGLVAPEASGVGGRAARLLSQEGTAREPGIAGGAPAEGPIPAIAPGAPAAPTPAPTTLAARGAGTVAGGVIGAAAPADTPEERWKHVAIGAGLGLALDVGAGVAASKLARANAARFVDPGVQAIADMHARSLANPSIWRKLATPFEDIGTQFEEQFLDWKARGNAVTTEARKALGVKRAEQTPRNIDFEGLGALWEGRDAAGAQWVKDGFGKVYEHLDTPLEEQALNAVLKLRRDIEVANIRLAKGTNAANLKFSGGVTSIADAQAKLAAIEQQIRGDAWRAAVRSNPRINPALRPWVTDAAWNEIARAEAAFRAHMDSILDAKVRSGLVDPQWAAWLKANHPNYSPSILADDAVGGATRTGGRFSVESQGIRRLSAEGHAEDDLPPLTAAVMQTLKENSRIMQNDAASALAHALEAAPSTKAVVARVPNVKITTGVDLATGVPGTKVAGRQPPVHIPGTISWWEDGTRHFMKVPDEFRPLVEGLQKDPSTAKAAGVFGRIAHAILVGPQQVARQFITAKNPVFPLINAQADMLVAMAQGVNPFEIAAGYAGRDAGAITRLGGGVTGWHGGGVQGAKALQGAMAPSGGLLVRAPGAAAKAMKAIVTGKPIEWYGSKIEGGPRQAAYRKALAAGATPERAALAARRVTLDFARSGALVRKANSYILFLNAGVQGVAQIARVARDNPKVAAGFLGMLNAATFGAYEWNRRFARPDGSLYYDDVPDYVKQTSLVMMAPGGGTFTDQDGKEMMHYVAVPLRQLGALGWAGTQAAQALHREMPDEYAKFMLSLGLRTLSPVQGESASQLVGSALPLGIGTAAELAANKDFYRGTDIIPQRQQGLSAQSQVGTHATETAKSVGGVLGAAPGKVQHVIDTLGGTAQQLTGLADIAQGDAASGEQALYRSTVGRLYRDQGGQIERDAGDVYAGGLDAAKARAFEALKQSPQWAAAKDEQARNSLERSTYARVAKDYQQQPGVVTPTWAQPPRPDRPAKYDARVPDMLDGRLPPEQVRRYRDDPYALERDVTAAQRAIADYRASRGTAPYPTYEQQLLAKLDRQPYYSYDYRVWLRDPQRRLDDVGRRQQIGDISRDAVATP